MSFNKLKLTTLEAKKVDYIVSKVTEEESLADISQKITLIKKYSCRLPIRILEFLKEFQYSINQESRLCLISNLIVNESERTPLRIADQHYFSKDDYLICMISSFLGEVFGWQEEQNGRIVHDIVPLADHENSQESTGSSQIIYWHTDEAFHDFSADYLALCCIKNPHNIATSYCSINSLDFSDPIFDKLFEPRFLFKKVSSHKGNSTSENIKPVLYGCRSKPFIRIDYYFMEALDPNANKSLKYLMDYINFSLKYIVLKPGDMLLIDNAMCVHGRNPFSAKYDGNDRWLKRVNITRDIYKTKRINDDILSRILN